MGDLLNLRTRKGRQKDYRMEIKSNTLWPTTFWHTIITEFKIHPTRVNYNEDLFGYINSLKSKSEGRIKSNRGGWQSDLLDEKNDELSPLTTKIFDMVNNIGFNNKFKMSQIWANVNRPGSFNIMHRHAGDTISGTYYVKTPRNCGRLQFRCPTNGIVNDHFWLAKNNGDFFNLIPEDGLLALWPSYVDHWVEPNYSNDERVSISFDLKVI